MTKLERFMESTKGLALGTVLAAALYPAAHGALADHMDRRLKVEGGSLLKPSVYDDGGEGFVTPFTIEMSRLEARMKVLDEAQVRLSRRNASLHWAMESFDELHRELESLVVADESRIDARDQLRLLSEVMVDWLEGMKADLAGGRVDGVEPAEVTMASLSSPVAASHAERLESLGHRIHAMAESLNVYIEDNKRTEGLLNQIVAQLDVVWRAAQDPASDIEKALDAFAAYTDILVEYFDPGNGDEIAEIIDEDARRQASAQEGTMGMSQ